MYRDVISKKPKRDEYTSSKSYYDALNIYCGVVETMFRIEEEYRKTIEKQYLRTMNNWLSCIKLLEGIEKLHDN